MSVRVPAYEPKKLTPRGWSPLAIPARKTWDSNDRPAGWKGSVYGLVVHTSGRGLPTKAAKLGEYPTKTAVDYYIKSHGTHYIIGYRGIPGGDLLQIASEDEQANGVGINYGEVGKNQYLSVTRRNWKKDLPASLAKRWQERWPGYSNPLDLLPNTKQANSCYMHVEVLPLVKEFGFEPAYKGSLFTIAQHEAVAALAEDIADRNTWQEGWERSPQLVGHEDLTPLPRHDSRGGWDPGWLRVVPYFSWPLVGFGAVKDPKTRKGGSFAKYR